MQGTPTLEGRTVGILGLARSGLATARALRAEGARIILFDDHEATLDAHAPSLGERGREADVARLDLLVASPGVPLTHPAPHPLIARAFAQGVPVTGDIDLFALRTAPRPIFGVTGTNGKSTTSALLHHLLVRTGHDAELGGNVGRAVFDLEPGPPTRRFVLELSSYQLDLSSRLRCTIACWTNLSPDHLDRHGSMAGYRAAKERIFANQGDGDCAVIGIDDPVSAEVAAGLRAKGRSVVEVAVGRCPAGGVGVIDGVIHDAIDHGSGEKILSIGGIATLRGAHNHQNAGIAYAAARIAGADRAALAGAFASFAGLPHRMEEVGRQGRTLFVNDSKATNPDSAAKSLAAFDPIFWIAGGKPKPGGFADLIPLMGHVRQAFLIGEAAPAMKLELGSHCDAVISGTLEDALGAASRAAGRCEAPSPVVLLAPACASFDQFTSFEARGDRFRAIVQAMIAGERAADHEDEGEFVR